MNEILFSVRELSKCNPPNCSLSYLKDCYIHICSENNFPTAAGLASSAAGYSCLGTVFEISLFSCSSWSFLCLLFIECCHYWYDDYTTAKIFFLCYMLLYITLGCCRNHFLQERTLSKYYYFYYYCLWLQLFMLYVTVFALSRLFQVDCEISEIAR